MAVPYVMPTDDDDMMEHLRAIYELLTELAVILTRLIAENPEWLRSRSPHVDDENNNNANRSSNPVAVSTPPHDCIHMQHHRKISRGYVTPTLASARQFSMPLTPPSSEPNSPSAFFNGGFATLFDFGHLPEGDEFVLDIASAYREERSIRAVFENKLKSRLLLRADSDQYGTPASPRPKRARTTYEVPSSSCAASSASADDATRKLVAQTSGEMPQAQPQAQSQPQAQPPPPQQQQQQASFLEVPSSSNDTAPRCGCSRSSARNGVPSRANLEEQMRKFFECFRDLTKDGPTGMPSDDDDFFELKEMKETWFATRLGRTMLTAILMVIAWKLLKKN